LQYRFKINVMEEKQLKLLRALAKKIKSEKKERAAVVASLQSAKILTKNENFTGHLKNLDKVFAEPE
jgi:hypothetical protein